MQRITLQIICYKSNRMLCKKRKMETSVKKEDGDKCAAYEVFKKMVPQSHFSWVLWLSRGLQAPPSRGYAPDHTPTKATPQNIHTHQLLICLTSHFTFYLDQILSSYPADLCFIIFHRFEFVSIKDFHSDLEQKTFIGLRYIWLNDLSSKCYSKC